MYRVLVLPDPHVPCHDVKTMAAVNKFAADNKFDEMVCLGDFMDFDMISKFSANMLRNLEGKRILKDYEAGNKVLDGWQAALGKKCKITLLEGNHDYRMTVLLDKAPQFEGMLEIETNLHLAERGVNWVKSWTNGETYKVGKLHFMHGDYVTKYHSHKMAEHYGVNLLYGHTHDFQIAEKTTHGISNPVMAMSLGHLADPAKLKYTRGRPNRWCQLIAVVEFWDDGNFNINPIRIINHKFSYNGRMYQP